MKSNHEEAGLGPNGQGASTMKKCLVSSTSSKLIVEGIGILREKFKRLDSIGPVWAAQTVEQATAGTDFDVEMEQRRAFEVVNALLREIDGRTGE